MRHQNLAHSMCINADSAASVPQAYAQAMMLMQKLLGVKPKLTARELCIQFGCVPVC